MSGVLLSAEERSDQSSGQRPHLLPSSRLLGAVVADSACCGVWEECKKLPQAGAIAILQYPTSHARGRGGPPPSRRHGQS